MPSHSLRLAAAILALRGVSGEVLSFGAERMSTHPLTVPATRPSAVDVALDMHSRLSEVGSREERRRILGRLACLDASDDELLEEACNSGADAHAVRLLAAQPFSRALASSGASSSSSSSSPESSSGSSGSGSSSSGCNKDVVHDTDRVGCPRTNHLSRRAHC